MPPLSPARRHFERVRAQREASRGGATAPAQAGDDAPMSHAGPLTERIAAQLALHQAHLKTIQSVAAKVAAKREFIGEFAAYVDGVLASDAGGADDVLTTIFLWRLDVGDWDGALDIAGYAIRHNLAMPAHITRSLPATLLEEMADAALAQIKAGDSTVQAMARPLSTALDLVDGIDMHDQIKAKALKALGLIVKDQSPADSVEYLKNALRLDSGCGVKTELARLEKQVSTGS